MAANTLLSQVSSLNPELQERLNNTIYFARRYIHPEANGAAKTAPLVNRVMANDRMPNGQPLIPQTAQTIEVTFNMIIGTKKPIHEMYKNKDKNHPDVRQGLESMNLMAAFLDEQRA